MKNLIKIMSVLFVAGLIFIPLTFNFPDIKIIYYIGGILMLFWYATFFVYLFQLAIIIVGLLFKFLKDKYTVKCLLIPYGFILILKNMYKELK